MHKMGLAKIYLYTKFDISSFTYSRFTEGDLKFKNSAPGLMTATFLEIFCHPWDGTFQGYWCTKFEVCSLIHSFQIHEMGFKI